MAQGALVVDQLAPGRLRLGIGPSHGPVVERVWGIDFDRPLTHLREYLQILRELLGTGRVEFDGKLLTAHTSIAAPTQVQVMNSALREKAFRLAGELSDGAISWMCPPSYIRDVARPALEAGARAAGRQPPKMIVHVPIVACAEWERVRAGARARFSFYQQLPYYSRMLQEAGYPEAANAELSDDMIRGLIVWGSDQQVADRLAELPSFGADEVVASIVELVDDPAPAHDRTDRVLGELARA